MAPEITDVHSRETHFRKGELSLCDTLENIAAIASQRGADFANIVPETSSTTQFNAERATKFEVLGKQLVCCRWICVVPDASVEIADECRGGHRLYLASRIAVRIAARTGTGSRCPTVPLSPQREI